MPTTSPSPAKPAAAASCSTIRPAACCCSSRPACCRTKGACGSKSIRPTIDCSSSWIAAGAPPPDGQRPAPRCIWKSLPASVVLKPGQSQRLLVRAYYTDGHDADVTRWVKFTSSDESVAQVDADGQVKIMGSGEGVDQRLVRQPDRRRLRSPCPSRNQFRPTPGRQAPRRNFIDELVLAKLERLNLPPSPRADDGDFLRRAILDTIGVLPTADETRGVPRRHNHPTSEIS